MEFSRITQSSPSYSKVFSHLEVRPKSIFAKIRIEFLQGILNSLQTNSKNALIRKVIEAFGGNMVGYLPIEELEKEGVHILRVGGRLDATTAPILERKWAGWVDTPGSFIVVNFSGLKHLSSAGMRVMLAASKRLKSTQGRMVFSDLQPQVMEILKLAGFDTVLELAPSENKAILGMKK